LREIEAVRILHRVWLQQYEAVADTEAMHWRQVTDQPPSAVRIHTPYDLEARYSAKRETTWLGYKVYLTESCDEGAPHLITHVLTTPATRVPPGIVKGTQGEARGALRTIEFDAQMGFPCAKTKM
jgi:hypothetical protein